MLQRTPDATANISGVSSYVIWPCKATSFVGKPRRSAFCGSTDSILARRQMHITNVHHKYTVTVHTAKSHHKCTIPVHTATVYGKCTSESLQTIQTPQTHDSYPCTRLPSFSPSSTPCTASISATRVPYPPPKSLPFHMCPLTYPPCPTPLASRFPTTHTTFHPGRPSNTRGFPHACRCLYPANPLILDAHVAPPSPPTSSPPAIPYPRSNGGGAGSECSGFRYNGCASRYPTCDDIMVELQ